MATELLLRHNIRRARRAMCAAVVALLVMLTIAGLLIDRSAQSQREALMHRFDARQATAARFIEAYVQEEFTREIALAGRTLSGSIDPALFPGIVTDQGFEAAVVLDARGTLLASAPQVPAAAVPGLATRYPHLRSAAVGIPAASGVVPSAARGLPVVAFAVPFETPTGRRVFSGAYAVEHTPVAPFVRNATPFTSADVLLVDAAGVLVAGNHDGDAGTPVSTRYPRLARVTSYNSFAGSGDSSQYVVQSTIPGTTWRMMFAVSTNELFAPLESSAQWIPWLALAALCLVALTTLAVFYRYLVQRAELVESEARRRAILDTAGDGFVGMNQQGLITEWNAAATRLLGYSATEVVGQSMAETMVPDDHRHAHLAGLTRFLDTGQPSLPAGAIKVQAMHRDGHPVDVEFTLSRMKWESGWQFHAFLRDISEQLRHERELQELALTDALTGLANRRAALNRLDQALARAQRRRSPLAVLYIDVDQFKAINDRLGHAAGDSVLVELAVRLRATCRPEDTVARLGGDEFLVVCEDVGSSTEVRMLADRTRAALAQPYALAGLKVQVTASVGFGVSDLHSTPEILLAHADAEMYDAKASRQAFVEIVHPSEG